MAGNTKGQEYRGTGTARLEYKSQISQARVIPGEKTLRGRTSWETFRVEL